MIYIYIYIYICVCVLVQHQWPRLEMPNKRYARLRDDLPVCFRTFDHHFYTSKL